MAILTWNILHGGGPRRVPGIVLSVLEHGADIVVLTEFRQVRGGQIRGVLADHGFRHQRVSAAAAGKNAVLIASRLELADVPGGEAPPQPGRWVEAAVPSVGVVVAGVHVPDDTQRSDKAAAWQYLVGWARRRQGLHSVVAGDFNTQRRGECEQVSVRGVGSGCEALLGSFCSLGFVDAWRTLHPTEREVSWESHEGERVRIDAVYVSTSLRGVLQSASYSHLERAEGLSDHSALMVTLGLKQGEMRGQTPSRAGLFADPRAARGNAG